MNSKTALYFRRLTSIALAFSLALTLSAARGSLRLSDPFAVQSYLVQGRDTRVAAAAVERYGGTVTSRLEIIRGVGALLPSTAVAQLLSDSSITAVMLNGQVKLTGGGGEAASETGSAGAMPPSTDYPDVIGADVVWQQGVTGRGITVAVVDTGLAHHRGLTRALDGQKDRMVGWVDFVEGSKKPVDPNGHGTHIAGIIANSQQGADGEWNGVAPGVDLVGVRVLDETGAGTYEQVIQGLQWVIQHKADYHIRVINLSMVSSVQLPYWADPLNQAVMQAWANGLVVVAAAGNGGPQPLSVGAPGNNPYVITVGAFTDNYTPADWDDDYVAPFSAAGPTLDNFVKPDVVAPGAHMLSTMSPDSYLARQHLANRASNQYFTMAGTSQAAAVVSGLAALVLSHHPDLTPDEVKYRLGVTAFPWLDPDTNDASYSMWQQGAGRVNAPDAVTAAIAGAANLGMDIQADLAGQQHYEGFSYYDEATGAFRLRGEFGAWDSTYGTWAGTYGTWAGTYGTWAGTYGTWAGTYGTWAGTYGTWAGTYGTWAGTYGTWAGGYTNWAGTYGAWAGAYGDPSFVASFTNPETADADSAWSGTRSMIESWIDER